jgi:hypothetical protein
MEKVELNRDDDKLQEVTCAPSCSETTRPKKNQRNPFLTKPRVFTLDSRAGSEVSVPNLRPVSDPINYFWKAAM